MPTKQCDNFTNICRFSSEPLNEYRNTCNAVTTNFLICKDGNQQNVATSSCPLITIVYKGCDKELKVVEPYSCESVSEPSIGKCAGASNNCRLSNGRCVSLSDKTLCKCDRSYSRSLCVDLCKCDFDLLGYCQLSALPPKLLPDQSNKYYQCYEVNLLHLNEKFINLFIYVKINKLLNFLSKKQSQFDFFQNELYQHQQIIKN